jgi:tRNA pseudouridine32 synthase/23S rRNA pseudouridine746 synthase
VVFPSPFDNQPHPLARQAASDLQRQLTGLTDKLHQFHVPHGGKMLGVLVVRDHHGALGYLAGFSGMLGNRWYVDGFVSPVFDQHRFLPLLASGESTIENLDTAMQQVLHSEDYRTAVTEEARMQRESQADITALRQQHQRQRQRRHELRLNCADDATLMQKLAAQSRNDKLVRQQLQQSARQQLQSAAERVQPFNQQLNALRQQRKAYSAKLQRQLFDCYRIASLGAESVSLRSLFRDKLPPGGAADCAAVKLLSTAIHSQLTPVCLAEFWWGADQGLRRHGRYYPACRSKCRPILPHMLQGVAVTVPAHEAAVEFPPQQPEFVFEDDSLVVLAKPAGMLSVPGQTITDSVETRLRARFPSTDNKTLLLHRLDQATSGLMVAAKSAKSYKQLQHQFQRRLVEKIYIANLAATALPAQGEITLPLRVDLDDRPRQRVCREYGKPSLTRFRVLCTGGHTSTVEFKPVTGRTHQLRIHAAHPQGLNAPIVGDVLYGSAADRLHLHAASLAFTHPLSGERMCFTLPVPFNPAANISERCAHA